MSEEIIEQGFIVKKDGNIAEIAITRGDQCSSCDNLFCKPHSEKEEENKIVALDELGADVGDLVKISISGKTVFKATFFMWVIPLIMLVAGIYLGLAVFNYPGYNELLSFLLGICSILLYFGILHKLNLGKTSNSLPKIITVTKLSHAS